MGLEGHKKVSRNVAGLATLILAITSAGPAFAAAWDFPTSNSVPNGSTLIAVNEASYFDSWNSWSSHKNGPFIGIGPESHICPTGPANANCDPQFFTVEAESIISFCATPSQENCIEGLRLKQGAGDWVAASFTKTIEGTTYAGDETQNRIAGSAPSLFTASGVKHSGNTDTYSVVVKIKQIYNASSKKFEPRSINAVVIPYTLRNGGTPPAHAESAGPDGIVRIGTRHDATCAWAGAGYCGIAEDFAAGTRAELSLRLPNTLAGWFRGRITSPEASITKFSGTNNKLVLAAEPVAVPRFAAYATAENTTARGIQMIQNNGGKNPNAPLFTGNAIKDFWATGWNTFELMQEFKSASKDTAAGISSLWNFSTIEDASNNSCMKDTSRVLGIVSTNATAYNGRTPDFSNGQLTYKVAGLHYAPDGKTLNEGTYDLLMRSDVARCLYGFTSAPVSASISVVSDSGENKIASTVVKEDGGWLTLRAAGFSYSQPTISIKLTQSAAKKTITCLKGKVTKKVTSTNPKCPAGYKAK